MTIPDISLAQLKALDVSELPALAADIREFLIETISETGGHIGANLGTVELTTALHYVFDSPTDAIVWDTGHQGYTHKILTGRADKFATLNTYGGMNRFVSTRESEHDIIEASHAGTSISVALGRALGLRESGAPGFSIAVIGDGALAEGLALEALNHASVEPGVKMGIVLNDNGFAISPGFGALHNYLSARQPGTASPETLFTAMGYEAIGPVDGHDTVALVTALEKFKAARGVPLLHVKTNKGHGYAPAEPHPVKMHFSFAYNREDGSPKAAGGAKNYQDIVAGVIGQAMETDQRLIAITPSTLYATGLAPVFERFPSRCFDPGMEEQHAMTMALGLSIAGKKPIVFYQSTFMQRAFDQLFHDICFSNRDILLFCARSGFAGYDNPTHHGIYDLSYLRCLPNLTILYPKDGYELEAVTRDQVAHSKGPTLVLMPYGPAHFMDDGVLGEPAASLREPEVVMSGTDVALVCVGNKAQTAVDVATLMAALDVSVEVINLRVIKPLPGDWLADRLAGFSRVVTLEEGVLDGGVGSSVASLVTDRRLGCEVLRIGLPCVFADPGSNDELSQAHGLTAPAILSRISKHWGL